MHSSVEREDSCEISRSICWVQYITSFMSTRQNIYMFDFHVEKGLLPYAGVKVYTYYNARSFLEVPVEAAEETRERSAANRVDNSLLAVAILLVPLLPLLLFSRAT